MMASVSQCPVPYQHCHSVTGLQMCHDRISGKMLCELFLAQFSNKWQNTHNQGIPLQDLGPCTLSSWSYPLNLTGRDLFLFITWTDDVSNQACIRLSAMQCKYYLLSCRRPQPWARQSYYDKAGVQILIMSDIFQIYTSHNGHNGPA